MYSQFSASLTHQGAAGGWLLATPEDSPLIGCKPDPSFVAIVAGIVLAVTLRNAERLSSADIFEHPLANHGLCDGIDYARILRVARVGGRIRAGSVERIASIVCIERVVCVVSVGRKLMLMPKLATMSSPSAGSRDIILRQRRQAWALRGLSRRRQRR